MSESIFRKVLVKTTEIRTEKGLPLTYSFKSASFHGWGVEYEEFETGIGNYTVAIVEYPDGHIETVHTSLIQFVNADNQSANCV